MKVALGALCEFLGWALCFTVFQMILPAFWDMDSKALPTALVVGWAASTFGFIIAGQAGGAIAKDDDRVHAFAIIAAILIMLIDIAFWFRLDSAVVWARIGGVVGAVIFWKMSGATLRRDPAQTRVRAPSQVDR